MKINGLPDAAGPEVFERRTVERRPEVREETKSEKADSDVGAKAAEVAQQLSDSIGDKNLRFIVRDPNSAGINNIIIEIRSGEKVIATIPSADVLRMAERAGSGGLSEAKGLIVDHHVH